MHKRIVTLLAALLPVLAVTAGAAAADLPKATQKALSDLKLEASQLDGLDAELTVPKPWLDEAAKEKDVVILGTWEDRQFRAMTAPFRERYPGITLKYSRAGTAQRGMTVLVALGQGRVIADVLTSIADATFQFAEMKALADLRDLPAFANVDGKYSADDGTWLSFKLSFRCLSYNTAKVKKEDLPQQWEDLLTNPRWRGGNLAISNEPNSWLLGLWAAKGEAWGADFTRRLFEEVKPQQRKEGMTATTALTVAGEFDADLPAAEWVAQNYAAKGAPLSYHCPAPIPITVSQIVMLEKSPHRNAAKLFINWMLSREGQLLQFTETSAVPIHKAMQSPRFLPFAETTTGKPSIVRDDALLGSELQKKMLEVWTAHWTQSGGARREN
jgi:iron(III) transport system substrate-binding protein